MCRAKGWNTELNHQKSFPFFFICIFSPTNHFKLATHYIYLFHGELSPHSSECNRLLEQLTESNISGLACSVQHASVSLPPPDCWNSRSVRSSHQHAAWFPRLCGARVLLHSPQAWLQGAAHHHWSLLGALPHMGGNASSAALQWMTEVPYQRRDVFHYDFWKMS